MMRKGMLNWKEYRFGPKQGGEVRVLEEMLPKFYKKLEILFRWLFKRDLDLKVIWFDFELLRKWVCFKFEVWFLEKNELCFELKLLMDGMGGVIMKDKDWIWLMYDDERDAIENDVDVDEL